MLVPLLAVIAQAKAVIAEVGIVFAILKGILAVLAVPLAMLKELWGKTESAAGLLDLADIKHAVAVGLLWLAGALTFGGKVFAFGALVTGDIGNGEAAFSALLIAAGATIAKWVTPGPAPKPKSYIGPDDAGRMG